MIDRRPSSGSCPVCQASLDLASLRVGGTWYCSSACAEGARESGRARAGVPEEWLYSVPRRFFRARRPKELNLPAPAAASRHES